jgi:hypothetical protein
VFWIGGSVHRGAVEHHGASEGKEEGCSLQATVLGFDQLPKSADASRPTPEEEQDCGLEEGGDLELEHPAQGSEASQTSP